MKQRRKRKLKFTKKEFMEAIRGNKSKGWPSSFGLKVVISSRLNCSRNTVNKYLGLHPELSRALEDEKESLVDKAESKLYHHIGEGNLDAIKYFLSRRGRHRGYGDRLENSTELTLRPVEVDLQEMMNSVPKEPNNAKSD